MKANHSRILEFLHQQNDPVSINSFPEKIKFGFARHTVNQGSLAYELDTVLCEQLKWVSKTAGFYRISEKGIAALNGDNQELKLEETRENVKEPTEENYIPRNPARTMISIDSSPKPEKKIKPGLLETISNFFGKLFKKVAR